MLVQGSGQYLYRQKTAGIFTSMNTITLTTPQNIELEYDLASLGERIAAYLIDGVILVAYMVIFVIIAIQGKFIRNFEWLLLLGAIPIFFYHLASEALMNGQSVGKKAMNIKVVSLNGAQPSLGQYVLRWVFRIVDFSISYWLCGVISIAVSKKNQRVGDMVAGTTLIKTIARTTLYQTIYTPAPMAETEYEVMFPEISNLSDRDMQLVKEVIMSVRRSGNMAVAQQAAQKIQETLSVKTELPPLTFLERVIADYNFITSK